ncbi:hypothetical protein predicted by Glimmer/Critica [Acetobacter senegalensis]|uniref:Uncharacterized protein n=1 Tax=Acetobacter senegalensis TaxID=446692 RepID=A0A0U5ER09_9PROT|nr:hypothetical protein [Acetobacter senegalensis]CEF40156.1 hypothetical protein predicted by Glimmer/Critica [Acetobacter senegalensis]
MQDNRCATAAEVAVLRERVARVEGRHDHLRDGLDLLSRQFSELRRDLTQAVDDNAACTRQEIMSRVDEMSRNTHRRDAEVSDRLSRIEGGIRLANWITVTVIAGATTLLGWARMGDALWHVWRHVLGGGA